jgi:hypothetical protein
MIKVNVKSQNDKYLEMKGVLYIKQIYEKSAWKIRRRKEGQKMSEPI